MKRIVLLLLLIVIVLVISSCNQVVKVEIMIPPNLIPFYEWLLSFPFYRIPPSAPQPFEIYIGMDHEKSWTIIYVTKK